MHILLSLTLEEIPVLSNDHTMLFIHTYANLHIALIDILHKLSYMEVYCLYPDFI